jgi:hypothetical protein
MDDSGVVHSNYEYLPITIGPDGSQTYTTWVQGAVDFGTARWRLGAYAVTRSDSARVDGSYIWAGGGEGAQPNNIVGDFNGAAVQPGGQLVAFVTATNPQPFAGYGAFAAGDYLYVLGGGGGLPAVSNVNVELSTTCNPCSLTGFQSFTPGMNTARVGIGSASQSGYFYILGGSNSGGVLTSTEFVLY